MVVKARLLILEGKRELGAVGVGFQLRSLRGVLTSQWRGPVNRTNQEHLFKVGAVGDFAGLFWWLQMVRNQLATQQTRV